MKKLMLAALICLLCAILASCTSPASSPGGELGGLTMVSHESSAGYIPAGLLVCPGQFSHYICQLDTIYFSG